MGRSRSGAATTSANSTGSPGCGTPGYAEECGLPPRAWCTPTTRTPCTWWTRSRSPTTGPDTCRSTSATRTRSSPSGGPKTLTGVSTCTGRSTTPDEPSTSTPETSSTRSPNRTAAGWSPARPRSCVTTTPRAAPYLSGSSVWRPCQRTRPSRTGSRQCRRVYVRRVTAGRGCTLCGARWWSVIPCWRRVSGRRARWKRCPGMCGRGPGMAVRRTSRSRTTTTAWTRCGTWSRTVTSLSGVRSSRWPRSTGSRLCFVFGGGGRVRDRRQHRARDRGGVGALLGGELPPFGHGRIRERCLLPQRLLGDAEFLGEQAEQFHELDGARIDQALPPHAGGGVDGDAEQGSGLAEQLLVGLADHHLAFGDLTGGGLAHLHQTGGGQVGQGAQQFVRGGLGNRCGEPGGGVAGGDEPVQLGLRQLFHSEVAGVRVDSEQRRRRRFQLLLH